MTLRGELTLQEAMDQSQDRKRNELMNDICITCIK
jgi:hypothetical protein